jgi:DNA polymerase-4
MFGVVDFAMSDEMQRMEHGVRVYRRPQARLVEGYRRVVGEFSEHIAHLDMDAFFVEVERRRRPDLVGKAVLVGGAGNRGVVASASYEARRRGVRSGMPMIQARRLVPHGVVVPPDHSAYREASDRVFEILDGFTPSVDRISVDEAFIEIGGLRLHYESPRACAEKMRAAIRSELALPSSVGIATTRLLAKMASRDAKPDGILVIEAGTELSYLHPKPVEALWGVGQATRARIEELGIATVGDLATFPQDTLVRRLGEALGTMLWSIAHGGDAGLAADAATTRSISVEQTYETDLTTEESMERELLAHADKLSSRLRRARYVASTITLKVRYPDFTTVSRSQSFTAPVSTSAEIFEIALRLLGRTAAHRRGVRLLGVGGDGLVGMDQPRQLSLGDSAWEEIDETVEKIRQRFGGEAVGRARLADVVDRDGGVSEPS